MYNEVAYISVYQSLKDGILSGEYPIGSLLPPEPRLEERFSVSRTTVRRATDLLVQEGYIKPMRGVGTVVLNYHITQTLNKVTSMTETLVAKGYTVTLKDFQIRIVEADEAICSILELEPHAKVAQIFRVQCANQTPVAILRNYIPYELVSGIEDYRGNFISLYKYLKEQYYIQFEMSQDSISAENATPEIAALLEVPENFALLTLSRRCYRNGKCICYDSNKIRPDMYSFALTLHGR